MIRIMDTYLPAKIRQAYRNLIDGFLTLLYPPGLNCPLCREALPREGFLCEKCALLLAMWREEPHCRRCGRLLGTTTGLCRDCQSDPPPFLVARAAAPYDGPFRQGIHRLKFHGEQSLAGPLGKLMGEAVANEPLFEGIQLIVPVPLHPRRLRERGFNQSGLLAEELSRQLNIPVREVLRKQRDTPDQVGLKREERLMNLAGAFTVVQPAAVQGKYVLLVDDIFTTGSTATHCVQALLSQGAAKVGVVVWAT